MAKLPEQPEDSATVKAIYSAYEQRDSEQVARGYLGASVIGKPCDRALWFGFRWARAGRFSGRMLRLFNTGHASEERFADELRMIGCEIHTEDPQSGRQFEVDAPELAPHFMGHMDGAAIGVPEAPKTWHVVEMKTHNARSFADLKANGVKASKPEHYCQMMVYMGLTGMTRALYMAENKDTSELYTERIRYSADEYRMLMDRAKSIIESPGPPERISDNPEHPECKWCAFADLCHDHGVPDPTCRSCVNATPVVGDAQGTGWRCEKHNKPLSRWEQARGCDDHLFIPLTIGYANAVDAGRDPRGDWIEYQKFDGVRFLNCKAPPHYSSAELRELPAPLVGAGTVEDVKRAFPEARVPGVEQEDEGGQR